MIEKLYTKQNLTLDLIHYIDRYLKTVIINAKRYYYKKRGRAQKYGIIFVDWESCENLLLYEEKYHSLFCQYIEEHGIKIPIYNPDLAEALLLLTDTQRTVLLCNIVLGLPLKQIALELNLSKSMIEKHKHNALELIRERMKNKNES